MAQPTYTLEELSRKVDAISEFLNEKTDRNLLNLNTVGQAIIDGKVEVEALLEQNGYAKFTWKEDNKVASLIIQFGLREIASTGILSFPVTFSQVSCFLRCNDTAYGTAPSATGVGYTNLTNSSVSLACDATIPKQSWIAIGT